MSPRHERLADTRRNTELSPQIPAAIHSLEKKVTDEEQQTMARYGITAETKTIYQFAGHKYARLSDATNYAKKVAEAAEKERATHKA